MSRSLGGSFIRRMHADFRNGVNFAFDGDEQWDISNHFDTAKGDLMRPPYIKEVLPGYENLDLLISVPVNPDGFRNGRAPPLIW
jgi:hypothetical protein